MKLLTAAEKLSQYSVEKPRWLSTLILSVPAEAACAVLTERDLRFIVHCTAHLNLHVHRKVVEAVVTSQYRHNLHKEKKNLPAN